MSYVAQKNNPKARFPVGDIQNVDIPNNIHLCVLSAVIHLFSEEIAQLIIRRLFSYIVN
jgi:hypothetical protein